MQKIVIVSYIEKNKPNRILVVGWVMEMCVKIIFEKIK
jgi:hypothetical protein